MPSSSRRPANADGNDLLSADFLTRFVSGRESALATVRAEVERQDLTVAQRQALVKRLRGLAPALYESPAAQLAVLAFLEKVDEGASRQAPAALAPPTAPDARSSAAVGWAVREAANLASRGATVRRSVAIGSNGRLVAQLRPRLLPASDPLVAGDPLRRQRAADGERYGVAEVSVGPEVGWGGSLGTLPVSVSGFASAGTRLHVIAPLSDLASGALPVDASSAVAMSPGSEWVASGYGRLAGGVSLGHRVTAPAPRALGAATVQVGAGVNASAEGNFELKVRSLGESRFQVVLSRIESSSASVGLTATANVTPPTMLAGAAGDLAEKGLSRAADKFARLEVSGSVDAGVSRSFIRAYRVDAATPEGARALDGLLTLDTTTADGLAAQPDGPVRAGIQDEVTRSRGAQVNASLSVLELVRRATRSEVTHGSLRTIDRGQVKHIDYDMAVIHREDRGLISASWLSRGERRTEHRLLTFREPGQTPTTVLASRWEVKKDDDTSRGELRTYLRTLRALNVLDDATLKAAERPEALDEVKRTDRVVHTVVDSAGIASLMRLSDGELTQKVFEAHRILLGGAGERLDETLGRAAREGHGAEVERLLERPWLGDLPEQRYRELTGRALWPDARAYATASSLRSLVSAVRKEPNTEGRVKLFARQMRWQGLDASLFLAFAGVAGIAVVDEASIRIRGEGGQLRVFRDGPGTNPSRPDAESALA